MTYKLYKTDLSQTVASAVMTIGVKPEKSFLFAPANTDYAEFKKAVMDGAELQDADGNVMTADEAKQFIGTLP